VESVAAVSNTLRQRSHLEPPFHVEARAMLFPRERAGPQRLAISAEAELLLVRSTLRSPAAPSGPSPDSPGPF